jgi:hypothetical protein
MTEYIKNEWHGLAHYECTICAYDTLSPEEMRAHTSLVHPALVVPLAEKKEK